MDAVIVAVGHKEYLELSLEDIKKLYAVNILATNTGEVVEEAAMDVEDTGVVLVDVKGIFNRKEAESNNYLYWRL